MKIHQAFAFLALAHTHTICFAASPALTTTVNGTGTYGNGDVYVFFNGTVNELGCSDTRVDVPAGVAAAKVLSIAQTAVALGKSVVVRANGCYSGYPTLDASRASWFYIVN